MIRRAAPRAEPLLVIALFAGLACVVAGRVVFSGEIIAGGDWSTPVTRLQLETAAKSGRFVWTHVSNVFGVNQSYLTTFTYGLYYVASLALTGPQIDRILLVGSYTLAGTSVYTYARRVDLRRVAALAAGALYVATPVFFDYTAMGWTFVLVAFSFTPWVILLFTRSVNERSLLPALYLALLFTVGYSFASQAVVWYPVTMLLTAPFVLRSRAQALRAIRTLAICGSSFLALNLHWVLPLAKYGSSVLTSSAAQRSALYGRNLDLVNIARGWGSLFNYQFETAYPRAFVALSFLPAVVGYTAFLVRPRDRRAQFFALLTLVPVAFYYMPDGFYRLPFTAVIEERSRFILFQALGSSLLVALAIDRVLSWRRSGGQRRVRIAEGVLGGLLVGLLLAGYPVWTGELTGRGKVREDIRLRMLQLPSEHDQVEWELARLPGTEKALYFPTGLMVGAESNPEFSGPYREFADSYAAYAPRPGGILQGDRRAENQPSVASFIGSPDFLSAPRRPSETLGVMGIRWIVVRTDFLGGTYTNEQLVGFLDADAELLKHPRGDVTLYENPLALPVLYASTKPIFHDTPANVGLSLAFEDGFTRDRRVAFFREAAAGSSNDALSRYIAEVGVSQPKVTFRRVNPTRFDIRLDDVKGPFFLVLSETFDPRWHLGAATAGSLRLPVSRGSDITEVPSRDHFVWSDASFGSRTSLPEVVHFQANGFANAWYVRPGQGDSSLELRAEFAPQALSYAGSAIAAGAFFLLVGVIALLHVRRTRHVTAVLVTRNEDE